MSLLKDAVESQLLSDPLKALNREQAHALVEALGIAVWCDFESNDYEEDEFETVVLDLSWSWPEALVDSEDLAEIKARAEAVCIDDEMEEAAEEIAEKLPKEVHGLLFALLSSVVDADGERNEEEQEMLDTFRVVLALDDEA